MRLRAAKLYLYAVQRADDGLLATFSMLYCCVAAGLDDSLREMQSCYSSEEHVKQQVVVGLVVTLDTWVVNQWEAARARSDPTAHQAMLRAAAKGYIAGAVGYDTHLAAATSAGLDVVAKRRFVSADVQQLRRRLINWTSTDDSDSAGDSDDHDGGGGGGGGGDGGGSGGGGSGGDGAAAGGSAAAGGGDSPRSKPEAPQSQPKASGCGGPRRPQARKGPVDSSRMRMLVLRNAGAGGVGAGVGVGAAHVAGE